MIDALVVSKPKGSAHLAAIGSSAQMYPQGWSEVQSPSTDLGRHLFSGNRCVHKGGRVKVSLGAKHLGKSQSPWMAGALQSKSGDGVRDMALGGVPFADDLTQEGDNAVKGISII
jgi:hypothetical protein